MSERWGGFSNEDKARYRAQHDSKCDITGDDAVYPLQHLMGCYVGRMAGFPEEIISDVDLNASQLSQEMVEMHDKEEDYQRACLEYELKGGTIYEGRTYANEEFSTRAKKYSHIQRSHGVLRRRLGRNRKSVVHWQRTTQSRRTSSLG